VNEEIGWKLLKELQQNPKLRREFAEIFTHEIPAILLQDKRVRVAILRAIVREAATKEDIEKVGETIEKTREHVEKVRQELKQEILRVRQELSQEISKIRQELVKEIKALDEKYTHRIEELNQRVAKLEGQFSLFVKLFIAFNVPLLTAVIGILLKMIFMP